MFQYERRNSQFVRSCHMIKQVKYLIKIQFFKNTVYQNALFQSKQYHLLNKKSHHDGPENAVSTSIPSEVPELTNTELQSNVNHDSVLDALNDILPTDN